MQKQPPRRLAIDGMVPQRRASSNVRRREAFPEVGQTISTYKHDAFSSQHRPVVPKKTRTGHKHRSWSKKRIVFFVLLPFLLVGLWLGGKFIYNAAKIFQGNIFNVLTTSKLDGEDRGRVNILVAGNSADDIGHNGGNLTDSIMVLSVDTQHNTAFLLSIPRDLYVKVPGYGHSKINEAYVDGESSGFHEAGYPEGGMGLLEKTIEESLNIDVNYYALVNYTALRDTVNAVGGIDVVIHSSDKRGLYDPNKDYTTNGPLVKLSNGPHHLGGQEALDLARARGDSSRSYGYANSDFTRTENQRMMLLALKSKIFSSGVLANPVKLGSLSDALGSNVKADMELSEVRRLYDIMKRIDNNQIKSYGLNDFDGTNYLAPYRTSTGQSTLVPAAGRDDFSDIQTALKRLMSNNQIVREAAKVVVLNATDMHGLAADNKSILARKNVLVTDVADANALSETSQIIDVSAGTMPKTLALLQSIYGQHTTTTNPYAEDYPDANFIVIVGNDKLPKQ